jgi:UDP-glucose 4-epimerase
MGEDHRSQVLVTGGSGFIGRRLVGALLARGHAVTVADKRPFPNDTADLDTADLDTADLEMVLGDLCDPAVVERAVRPGTEVIVHLAAITRVLDSINDPVGTHQLNVDVTANLLEQARQQGVGTFILASTNAVTGDVGRAMITEDIALRPLTPYGATKAAGEMLLSSYSACYDIAGCALRFSNVYGPGMAEKDSFVPRLMRAARDGRGVEIYGDGTQIRDLVHVDDIVAGIFAAWAARVTGPLILGAGESVPVNEILAAARSVTGAELPAQHVPAKPGEMPAVIVDISRARSIGFEPKHDLKSGLATVWPEFAEAAE